VGAQGAESGGKGRGNPHTLRIFQEVTAPDDNNNNEV